MGGDASGKGKGKGKKGGKPRPRERLLPVEGEEHLGPPGGGRRGSPPGGGLQTRTRPGGLQQPGGKGKGTPKAEEVRRPQQNDSDEEDETYKHEEFKPFRVEKKKEVNFDDAIDVANVRNERYMARKFGGGVKDEVGGGGIISLNTEKNKRASSSGGEKWKLLRYLATRSFENYLGNQFVGVREIM